jgi:hypothetical protein
MKDILSIIDVMIVRIIRFIRVNTIALEIRPVFYKITLVTGQSS